MNIIIETFLIALCFFIYACYGLLLLITQNKKIDFLLFSGLILQIAWLVFRTLTTSWAPFSNIYESLVFFSLLFALKINFSKFWGRKFTGIFILILCSLLISALFIPLHNKLPKPTSLPLYSFWIFIHVPFIFLGYVSIIISFIMSLINLAKTEQIKVNLDLELKQAFFFTAMGIISGGFWAEQSWGYFFNWDNKEIWALITWFFIGLALNIKNKQFRFSLILSGFLSMLFTYFGVTYLLPGLHSYF